MAKRKAPKVRWYYFSAITGRIVTKKYAEAHPKTTVRHRVRLRQS